jgi:LysM repeat protein
MPKSPRRRSSPSVLALLAVPFVVVGVVASKVAHASHRRRTIAAPETGPSYRVELGDTVSEIAISHGLPTAHVLAQNGLSWKTPIFPGQVIKLDPVPEFADAEQLLQAEAERAD